MGRVLKLGWVFLALGWAVAASANPVRVFVSSPRRWLQGKAQISAPIYITNFSPLSLTQVDFSLSFDSSKIQLYSIRSSDSVLSRSYQAGSWQITWRSLAGGQGYGWLKIADAVFNVGGVADSAWVRLGAGFVNGDSLTTFGQQTFWLKSQQGQQPGDLNHDTVLTPDDAVLGFQSHATGSGPITNPEYELSRRSPVCAHDFALLYRHVLGLMPALPQTASTVSSGSAQLIFGAPEAMGSDYYRYPISTAGAPGLISAELSLNVNATVIEAVQSLSGTGWENQLYGRSAPNSRYFIFAAYYDDSLAASIPRIFSLVVKHRPGQTASGLSLYSALLNEGQITGSFTTKPNLENNGTPVLRVIRRPVYSGSQTPPGSICPERESCFNSLGRKRPSLRILP